MKRSRSDLERELDAALDIVEKKAPCRMDRCFICDARHLTGFMTSCEGWHFMESSATCNRFCRDHATKLHLRECEECKDDDDASGKGWCKDCFHGTCDHCGRDVCRYHYLEYEHRKGVCKRPEY